MLFKFVQHKLQNIFLKKSIVTSLWHDIIFLLSPNVAVFKTYFAIFNTYVTVFFFGIVTYVFVSHIFVVRMQRITATYASYRASSFIFLLCDYKIFFLYCPTFLYIHYYISIPMVASRELYINM